MERRLGNPAFGVGNLLDEVKGPVQVASGRIGERQYQAGLPGLQVVGVGASLDPFRGRSNDGPGEPGNRLLAVEIERFLGHPLHGTRARLGRLEIERPVDARGFLGGRQQLFREQFQPGICHGAAVPADQNELLALEITAEKSIGLRFRVFEGKPALHVIAVVALGLDRPHHDQRQHEYQDRHDPDTVPLVKVRAAVRHHCSPD